MTDEVYTTSSNFSANLQEDIEACFRSGNTIEAFLKSEFGIEKVLDNEFSDFKDKTATDFRFSKVRGNTRLMEGKIITFKESQDFMDKVLSRDMSQVLSFKP